MRGLVITGSVRTVMENNFYTVGGLIQKQTDGGAIGSDIIGEMSRTYRVDWNEKFNLRLKDAMIDTDLYRR